MASPAEWAKAMQEWLSGAISPAGNPATNFYQTRVTHTPGVVKPVEGAAAIYRSDAIPSDIARSSNLPDDVRSSLANLWGQQRGFIESNPGAASQTLRHEQLHDVFARSGLSAADVMPLVDPGMVKYVQTNPIYSGITPTRMADEALAYELASGAGAENKNLASLRDRIAEMLVGRGKSLEASQLKKLAK